MEIEFRNPTQAEIVNILRKHPLVKLREKVIDAYVVGSQAKQQLGIGQTHSESDVDILLEIIPSKTYGNDTSSYIEDQYRNLLRAHFMKNNIRGKMDSVHPQWLGRRVDIYMTFDADAETRPKIKLQLNDLDRESTNKPRERMRC